jgi:hypothetical protein
VTFALLLALLAGPADDQRAQEFFGRIHFEAASPDTDEAKRVVAILTRKENWIGAHRAIEQRYGAFPDDLAIEVDFNLSGGEVGWGKGEASGGKVRFNLGLLAEQLKKADELQARIKEAQIRGQRATVKVPPIRIERIIYHELTHVLQRGIEAPGWFVEGMAQLVADDPNNVASFAHGGKTVQGIDSESNDRNIAYARGHLFWKWLDSKGGVKKTADLLLVQHRPWKQALEEAAGESWLLILIHEEEWSTKEVERLRK